MTFFYLDKISDALAQFLAQFLISLQMFNVKVSLFNKIFVWMFLISSNAIKTDLPTRNFSNLTHALEKLSATFRGLT